MTNFLQQGRTYSNNAKSPKSAVSYEPSIQTHDSMGAISIQIITDAGNISMY